MVDEIAPKNQILTKELMLPIPKSMTTSIRPVEGVKIPMNAMKNPIKNIALNDKPLVSLPFISHFKEKDDCPLNLSSGDLIALFSVFTPLGILKVQL